MKKLLIFLVLFTLISCQNENVVLLQDSFDHLTPGMFSSDVVGAHAEYHYITETAPQGNWVVSCFKSVESQRAWRVTRHNGQAQMSQIFQIRPNERKYTHPIIIAGDSLWTDYKVTLRFAPHEGEGKSGLLFRYVNDRCYYFAGVENGEVVLQRVKHAKAYHQPDISELASQSFPFKSGKEIMLSVKLTGDEIIADFDNEVELSAREETFGQGKIGLLADFPTDFRSIKVETDAHTSLAVSRKQTQLEAELQELREQNPKMKVWKKAYIDGFGVGRNLRFGDLDGDGVLDVLIGQVTHHGPKDRNSELSCLTAMTFDGKILWQIGEPDPWNDHLTNDVAFQIHDLDGDGRNEVVYCMYQEMIVADGATGTIQNRAPTPQSPTDTGVHNRFERILGDCIYFCDLRGVGRDADIIIKDRYRYLWAYDDNLQLLWSGTCQTGHYPFAYDIDADGRDEIAIGYSMFDHDGRKLWSLDDQVKDHADGVAVVRFHDDQEPRILNAASDEGIFFTDLQGNILKHHYLGHVQNPAVANFRSDLPGLEAVSINFWGNQGIINFYDSEGEVYQSFEPVQHGSMCLPVNWTGKDEEFFVLSASVVEGGLYDGWGRCVVNFPADGHPELCNAVMDITGDSRDEIVVWDPYEIWVYTQEDNPRSGKLYQPERNPLYNSSNYQATVSLPDWSE